MTLQINLPPETAASLTAETREQGLTPEEWLQRLVAERLERPAPPDSGPSSALQLAQKIRERWKAMPADVRAEYPEGGALQVDHHLNQQAVRAFRRS